MFKEKLSVRNVVLTVIIIFWAKRNWQWLSLPDVDDDFSNQRQLAWSNMIDMRVGRWPHVESFLCITTHMQHFHHVSRH